MVTGLRLLPFGDRAVLAEVPSLHAVLDLHAQLTAAPPPGVVDIVPAARTVLVRVDPGALPLTAARAWITAAAEAPAAAPAPSSLIELPITYDGADLAETADLLGLTPAELTARHAAAEWTVAFTGFAPGFGYLVSEGWPFDVPRRATPRTRVPAGAVGLAGAFSGAYPRETPGGWQLIGATPASLFDPDAGTSALLAPGARVRFVPQVPDAVSGAAPVTGAAPADRAGTAGAPRPPGSTPSASRGRADSTPPVPRVPATPNLTPTPALTIREPGLLATVQDQGRPGHAAEGVAVSGALDRAALRTANRLVGNDESAAGVEITLGGFRAVAHTDLWVAVTGAWGPIRCAGRELAPYEAHLWPAGAELQVDWFTRGARGYLAVRGGLDARAALGSRSTDILSGLGPAPLAAGAALALAAAAARPVPPDDLHPWSPPRDDLIEVELAPGPRADWFAPPALAALFEAAWTVTGQADRVGIRLDGPLLDRVRTDELPSEGMAPGALQVPPAGRPVILGADGPVTGGYPVIAVVTDTGRDALAQARPGTTLRFRHARTGPWPA